MYGVYVCLVMIVWSIYMIPADSEGHSRISEQSELLDYRNTEWQRRVPKIFLTDDWVRLQSLLINYEYICMIMD